MRNLLRWCWFVLAASASATCAGAQATKATRRLSSVLLRPPPAAVARVLTRPAAPVAAMANASAAQTTAPLVLAARARLATEYGAATTTTIAAASLITSPDSAARGLAHSLYGRRAQLATVRVVNTQTFGVWVGDTAEKQKAPSGLDVREDYGQPDGAVWVVGGVAG